MRRDQPIAGFAGEVDWIAGVDTGRRRLDGWHGLKRRVRALISGMTVTACQVTPPPVEEPVFVANEHHLPPKRRSQTRRGRPSTAIGPGRLHNDGDLVSFKTELGGDRGGLLSVGSAEHGGDAELSQDGGGSDDTSGDQVVLKRFKMAPWRRCS